MDDRFTDYGKTHVVNMWLGCASDPLLIRSACFRYICTTCGYAKIALLAPLLLSTNHSEFEMKLMKREKVPAFGAEKCPCWLGPVQAHPYAARSWCRYPNPLLSEEPWMLNLSLSLEHPAGSFLQQCSLVARHVLLVWNPPTPQGDVYWTAARHHSDHLVKSNSSR